MNAAEHAAVSAALCAAGIAGRISEARDLSGGCIHRVRMFAMDDGCRYVAKIGAIDAVATFEEEAFGLRALAAANAIITPIPLAVVAHDELAVLLMTVIEGPATRPDERAWRRFGEDLAALHVAPLAEEMLRGYGFPIDNHLGSTPQPNDWCDDWVVFNARNRLGHLARLASARGVLNRKEVDRVEACIGRLATLLPRKPRVSLVHGDLWAGNTLPADWSGASNSRPQPTFGVIDPAPYVGDALVDIAMMRLFGGFDRACIDSWAAAMGTDLNDTDVCQQIAVHQLYHLLNHVHIFGRGYWRQADEMLRRLGV